jgi:hypothetical protein
MASVEAGRQQSRAGDFPIGQRVNLPGHFREPAQHRQEPQDGATRGHREPSIQPAIEPE